MQRFIRHCSLTYCFVCLFQGRCSSAARLKSVCCPTQFLTKLRYHDFWHPQVTSIRFIALIRGVNSTYESGLDNAKTHQLAQNYAWEVKLRVNGLRYRHLDNLADGRAVDGRASEEQLKIEDASAARSLRDVTYRRQSRTARRCGANRFGELPFCLCCMRRPVALHSGSPEQKASKLGLRR